MGVTTKRDCGCTTVETQLPVGVKTGFIFPKAWFPNTSKKISNR